MKMRRDELVDGRIQRGRGPEVYIPMRGVGGEREPG